MAEPDSEEFQEFSVSAMPRESRPEMVSLPQSVSDFRLSEDFWKVFTSDPAMRQELDRMIEGRVHKELQEKTEREHAEAKVRMLEEVSRKGFEAGYQHGLDASRETIHQALRTLEDVAKTVLSRQSEILASHETLWCATLKHLLKRFRVPEGTIMASEIESWVSESLDVASSESRLKVFLSTKEYERVNGTSGEVSNTHFVFEKDESLQQGEIRCESEMGGIIFSPEKGLRELESIIDRFCGERP